MLSVFDNYSLKKDQKKPYRKMKKHVRNRMGSFVSIMLSVLSVFSKTVAKKTLDYLKKLNICVMMV